MLKLSIIIPVYNVEKYLEKCIESILKANYQKEYEIILINDGSVDRSGEICDIYAKKYSQIMVVHQQNLGLYSSRNSGIEVAKGKYIYFVDSDDWVHPHIFRNTIDKMEMNNLDVLIFGHSCVDCTGNKIINHCDLGNNKYIGQEKCRNTFIELHKTSVTRNVWNKIYKRSIIIDNSLRFINSIRDEDSVFNLDYFNHVSRMGTVSGEYYYYRVDNITNRLKKFPSNYFDSLIKHHSKLISTLLLWGVDTEDNIAYADRYFISGLRQSLISFYYNNKKNGNKVIINRYNAILQNDYIRRNIKLRRSSSINETILNILLEKRNAYLMLYYMKIYFIFISIVNRKNQK